MRTWLIIGVLVIFLGAIASWAIWMSSATSQAPGWSAYPDTSYPGNNQPSPTPDSNVVKQKAQIESASIAVAESYPPQYFVQVKYGLPDGCSRPGGYEVDRNRDTINVAVYVARPAAPDMSCTMIYRTDSVNIPLGSDFESGKNYSVAVNGQTTSFRAQ